MKLHKSGLIGLVLGAVLLGACEDRVDIVIPPPPDPPITLNLVPDAVTVPVGGTTQLVAVVTGGPAGTVRTATFTSSNTDVATVDASTGVVTGVAPGQATITARATADQNAADASVVTVTSAVGEGVPTVSIQRVTQFGTQNPVQINNVFGQIDIVANLDVPEGVQIGAIEFLVSGAGGERVVCRQTFTGAAIEEMVAAAEEAQAPVEIVCSVNTAHFDAETGAVEFPNGNYQLGVRVIGPTGTVVAEAPPTAFSQLVFNNINFIRATFEGSRGTNLSNANSPRSVVAPGLLWHSGDFTVNMLSVNYGAAGDAVASAAVTLTSSGRGVTGVPGCVTTNDSPTDPTIAAVDGGAGALLPGPPPVDPTGVLPNCPEVVASRQSGAAANDIIVTFPENATLAAANPGVMNVEDVFSIAVTSITTGGQAGPTCINPDPNFNPQIAGICGTFFANPPRIDNLAPRLVVLDHFRNPNNYFGPNSYLLSHVAGVTACPAVPAATPWFGLRRPCVRSVDYGVGSQTTAANTDLTAVVAATGTEIPANTPADLAGRETPTSLSWRLLLRISDSAGNQRPLFATTTFTNFATAAAGGNQLWGWDETPPTQAVAAGAPANMSVNTQIPVWVVTFTDAATPPAGPSGFDVNPVWVRLQRDAASLAASTCHMPDAPHPLVAGGGATGCTGPTAGFVADDGNFDNPGFAGGLDGYYTHRHFVVDAAANLSAEQTRWTLNDFTAPSFTGGIVVPATIAGGQPVSFSSALVDNVDLGALDAFVGYGGTFVQFAPKSVLSTFSPDLLVGSSAGPMATQAFVRRLEGNAAGRPDGAPVPAAQIDYLVRDMAGQAIRYIAAPWGVAPYTAPNDGLCPAAGSADGSATQNCSLRSASIATQVLAAVGGAFPAGSAFPAEFGFADALHGLFTMQAPSAATICNNDPRVNCPAAMPFTTTLSVTLTGPAATYQTPFVAVDLYYVNADGYLEHIGTAGAPSVTDNTVLNTRTFTYSGTWDARNWKVRPAGAAPGTAHTVVAIGRNAAGDSWISTAGVVNVQGD